jgi:coiled-coil domain-containing protein 130
MDYVVVSGASRKNERWQEKEGETVSVEGHSEAQKLASDPMYRLEHGVQDKTKADEAAPRIAKIMVSSLCHSMHLYIHCITSSGASLCVQ